MPFSFGRCLVFGVELDWILVSTVTESGLDIACSCSELTAVAVWFAFVPCCCLLRPFFSFPLFSGLFVIISSDDFGHAKFGFALFIARFNPPPASVSLEVTIVWLF